MTDRTWSVLAISTIGLLSLAGAIFLYARLMNESSGGNPVDAATLAVLVGAIGGLTTLAGTCVGGLLPSPLSKTTTAADEPTQVTGPDGGPVAVIADEAGQSAILWIFVGAVGAVVLLALMNEINL